MDHLQTIKVLSWGKYIEVLKVYNTTSGEIFVIKKYSLINVNFAYEKKGIENEINILSMIQKYNHQNMIKLYNLFYSNNHIYLAIEFCNGGNLYENLQKYKNKYGKPFPEDLVQKLMKKILKGVKFLHDNGIIHRDLRLKNILLKYDNDFDLNNNNIYKANVKIIDFNFSQIPNDFERKFKVNKEVNNTQINGTYQNYDKKVDILSLGILCYEMLFGKALFGKMTNEQIYLNINSLLANFRIPKTITVQARTFLYCMIQKDGNNRWNAEQLLMNEFITGNCHNFAKYDEANIPFNKIKPISKPIHRSNTTLNLNFNLNGFKNNYSPLNTDPNENNICKECKNIITDDKYKCEKCHNITYCKECYYKNILIHNHTFLIVPVKRNDNIEQYPIINCIFKRSNNRDIVISQYSNIYVGKLLEYYFVKINRPDLMHNYKDKIRFFHSSKNLNKLLNVKICDVFHVINPSIDVIETHYF